MGSIPGLGRCHMLHSNQACAPQLQSQCSRDHRQQLLNTVEPVLKRSTTTTMRSPCTAEKRSPLSPQLEKVLAHQGFPDSSVGKESTCNAGNPGLIPGLGWSPGEAIGNPLQYSWGSLVAQLVKNLPAMQETWVQSLGWEDPLEKGKTTYASVLVWRTPQTL